MGPLIALIPFLLNFEYWQENEGVWVGLQSAMTLGIVIGIMISLVFGGVYAGLTWISIRTGKFYQPPIFLQILLGVFAAGMGMRLVSFGKSIWRNQPMDDWPYLSAIIFSGIIATAFSLYFAYRRAKEESLALRAESAEARYHALEQQMRPHFLFNALNSLAELIESGQESAAGTAYKLSDLYRRILANSGLKTAPLSSELEIVTAYLELEHLRFGNRLKYEIHVPENSNEIFLPSLMLQTLVENAIKHGIAPSVEGGCISVNVVCEGSQGYQLSVVNTGAPLIQQTTKGTGLANTRARLDLLYGAEHGFEVRTDDAGRTIATFHLTGRQVE